MSKNLDNATFSVEKENKDYISNVERNLTKTKHDLYKNLDYNGNIIQANNSLKLEGESLNDISAFAAIEGPESFNAHYKANWGGVSVNSDPDIFEITSTGIIIKKDGYYYCEVVQRAGNSDNRYVGVSLDGDRSALEDNDLGVWGHDHSANVRNWSRSFYLGYLSKNSKVSGGWVEDGGSAEWGIHGYFGILQIRRIK